jgi:hypothetical protein
MKGTYRVKDRGNGKVLAMVRLPGDGTVLVQWFGKGEWEKDDEGLGLLLGDFGSVDKVSEEVGE